MPSNNRNIGAEPEHRCRNIGAGTSVPGFGYSVFLDEGACFALPWLRASRSNNRNTETR
jgi:hypothetical protein